MSTFLDLALGHDWTGVFVTRPKSQPECMVLTACHHDDNVFYEIGVVEHEVTARQLLAFLPQDPSHVCETANICWVLDFYFDDDLADNREVTREQAADLLGITVDELDERLQVGRNNHEAWVDKANGAA